MKETIRKQYHTIEMHHQYSPKQHVDDFVCYFDRSWSQVSLDEDHHSNQTQALHLLLATIQ